MGRTLRQFTCRDDLWARVEALAQRREISTDDVVQAALVQLFTKKRATSGANGEARRPAPPAPAAAPRPAPVPRPAPLPRPPGGGGRLPTPSGAAAPATPEPAKTRPLYLYFEGQCYAIDQEQFVIGRGSKYSDLPIKDANISRRHCAIVRRDGSYFVKDLGSTNGVEYNGERVDDHKIEEGTLYRLCDHELRFSFIPPA
ncbi:MAG: FHA domain-containing protein [Deltaproteobacteria bacterium]|nr:FHA domain-containing protein [Deltaproteobacteria bacterium]